MKRLASGAFVALIVSLAAIPATAQKNPIASCPARFDAQVTSGPDAGLVIGGDLFVYVVPSGRAHGTLTLDGGGQVAVTGQVSGADISLALEGLQISGVGTTQGDFSTCNGSSEGSLFGPRRDDTGDWGIIWGS